MTPGVFDHLLAVLLVIVIPVFSARSRKGMEKLFAARGADARRVLYARLMAWQWLVAGAAIALWAWTARPWRDLGIAWPSGWGFAIALAATLAVLGYLAWQARSPAPLDVDPDDPASAVALAFIVPRTPVELRWVKCLCLTAGVVEELLFRGFLLWYLGAFVPTWAAVGCRRSRSGSATCTRDWAPRSRPSRWRW